MNKITFLILLVVPLSVLITGIAFEAFRRLISKDLRQQVLYSVRRFGLTQTIRRELGKPRVHGEGRMKTESSSETSTNVFLAETEWIQKPRITTEGEEVSDATRYFGIALIQGSRIEHSGHAQ